MPTSNIDDLLMGGAGNSQQPPTPESDSQDHQQAESLDTENQDYGSELDDSDVTEPDNHEDSDDFRESVESKDQKIETDEYGNEAEPENKEIRERLKKQASKFQREIEELRSQLVQQGASQQVQQAAQDFEYDPNSKGDWQQQLASFVKQTVNSMGREQEESKLRQQEQATQVEFESKFRDGMNRFDDFRDVMTALPFEITNPMTLATRAMENPAAFLYAAAKRNPQELERISKIRDPYAQMTEMGKLEERMRKNKPTTKAPRPLGRTSEDTQLAAPKKKVDLSGDDLLAKADAKRLATVKTRLRGNR